MTIRWTPTALTDLQSVHAYIAEDNHQASVATVDHLLDAIRELGKYPQMGRPGRVSGTRELVVRPYVIAYRPRRNAIEVLAIIHGARRWPKGF
jgi:toxin ParE1/3/4